MAPTEAEERWCIVPGRAKVDVVVVQRACVCAPRRCTQRCIATRAEVDVVVVQRDGVVVVVGSEVAVTRSCACRWRISSASKELVVNRGRMSAQTVTVTAADVVPWRVLATVLVSMTVRGDVCMC